MKVILFIIAFVSSTAVAQHQVRKIKSKVLDEEIEIWIKTPQQYTSTTATYPVMYVLDADGVFPLATEINQYLAFPFAEHMPPVITVGIRSKSGQWRRNFIPPDSLHKTNTALKILQFFQKDLFPEIQSNYRVADFKILVGHSLGGLFATYAMFTNPDLFQAYIAISPSVNLRFKPLIDSVRNATFTRKTFYHFSVASNDLNNYQPAIESFRDTLSRKVIPNLEWKYMFAPNKDHWTIAPAMLYEALTDIFSPWQLTDPVNPITLDRTMAHRKVLKEKYGYEVNIETRLAQFGKALLANDRLESSKRTFETIVSLYPDSPAGYYGLSDYYMAVNDKTNALSSINKAITTMKKIKSPEVNEAEVLKKVIEKM